MTMQDTHIPGLKAIVAKGWLQAHKWLVLRRASQAFFLSLFLAGPLFGLWVVTGTLSSSLTLGVLPLSDPYILLQSFFAGHPLETSALIGAGIVITVYALIGGRIYCSFVCPVNPITDGANWLAGRFNFAKGRAPKKETRLWILAMTLIVSAITGTIAWELVNPVSMLFRGIVFGLGFAWIIVLGVVLFDLFIARRGWCSHLCPVGAFYGLIGSFALLRVSAKNRAACDDCMDCFAICPEPHVITPALKGAAADIGPVILSRDCTNCGRCIDVCPENVFIFASRIPNKAGEEASNHVTPEAEIQARRAA
jgi:ferredoxin-type protein NapH